MRRTIIYLVVIILIVALASLAIARDDSPLHHGIMIVDYPIGVKDVKIQQDGKILVCGLASVEVTPQYKSTQAILIRLTADGSPDRTFGKSGMVTTKESGFLVTSCKLALQEDGKAILAGTTDPMDNPLEREKYHETGKSNKDVLVIRYDTDGQLDKTFNESGWVKTDIDGSWNDAHGLTIQKDGKIIVVGSYLAWRNAFDFMLLRYNKDGKLDEEFGDGGKVIHHRMRGFFSDHVAHSVTVRGDGKIVVVGEADGLGDMDQNMALVQYKSDGSTDWTFGFLGNVINKRFGGAENYSIASQDDGKIIIGVGSKMVRFNKNGFLDETFGNEGEALYYSCNRDSGCHYGYKGNVTLQGDDKILFFASAFYNYKGKGDYEVATTVGRTNSDGTLDTSFGHKGLTRLSGLLGDVIAVQPDGKIIVAGSVHFRTDDTKQPSPSKGAGLLRLKADGQLLESFGPVH